MRIHDGAYGTLLRHHLHGDETTDDLCLRSPAVVVDAHRAYLDAGASAIQSNAFLAFLRSSERRRSELQRAALSCAREAASTAAGVLVIATMGPAGPSPRDFWRDLELLLELDAEAVQCETVTDPAVARAFLAAWEEVARGVQGVQVRLGCSVAPSRGADSMRWVLDLAGEAPDEVLVGLNCCEGPSGLRPVLEALVEARGSAWLMPSAGLPVDGRWPLEPHRWADETRRLAEGLPVVGLGGCCGTAPQAITALAPG